MAAAPVPRDQVVPASAENQVAGKPFALPTATYPLDEATQAWEAQASSPGKKIVVIP